VGLFKGNDADRNRGARAAESHSLRRPLAASPHHPITLLRNSRCKLEQRSVGLRLRKPGLINTPLQRGVRTVAMIKGPLTGWPLGQPVEGNRSAIDSQLLPLPAPRRVSSLQPFNVFNFFNSFNGFTPATLTTVL